VSLAGNTRQAVNQASIAAPVMWKLAQADLPALEKVCREEPATKLAREKRD
jgi:hypothetical protein